MATTENKKSTTSAGRKSTTKEKVETAKMNTVVDEKVKTTEKNENELLKAQIAEQNAKMEQMQAQMQAMFAMMGNIGNSQKVEKTNRMIRFISLKESNIVLKGTNVWRISGRYNYVDLPEKEARAVVLNMNNYLRKGSVYIDDADFVRENDLDTYYATLLSDKDLKELLSKDVTKVLEIYKNVNDNQKEIIIDLVKDNRRAGIKIDNNILVELSELSGKNLLNPDDED